MAVSDTQNAEENLDAGNVLVHVRRLIDTAMSNYRGGSVSYLPDRQAVRDTIKTMVQNDTQDVRSVVSTVFFARELGNAISDLDERNMLDPAHIEVLCDPSVAPSEAGPMMTKCQTSALRVAPWPLPDLLLVNREKAFCRLPTVGHEALFTQCSGLVELLHAFYAEAWKSAHSVGSHVQLNKLHSCAQTRQILTMLELGHKDAVAARQLGVSVRTYRRHVAELLRDLDAHSRFQVGVRAAQLGLCKPAK